jgi:hypothetical protein
MAIPAEPFCRDPHGLQVSLRMTIMGFVKDFYRKWVYNAGAYSLSKVEKNEF